MSGRYWRGRARQGSRRGAQEAGNASWAPSPRRGGAWPRSICPRPRSASRRGSPRPALPPASPALHYFIATRSLVWKITRSTLYTTVRLRDEVWPAMYHADGRAIECLSHGVLTRRHRLRHECFWYVRWIRILGCLTRGPRVVWKTRIDVWKFKSPREPGHVVKEAFIKNCSVGECVPKGATCFQKNRLTLK